MKRFPPYGKKLMGIIHNPQAWPKYHGTSPDGEHLTIWIAIGKDAWEWAKLRIGRMLIVVIPETDNPECFNLTFVKGHDPILVQQCGTISVESIQSLVTALIRNGSQRVLVMQPNGSTLYRVPSHE